EKSETEGITQSSLSHTELMRKFERKLGVSWNDVYIGTAVEQAIVGIAGIATQQIGAQFRTSTSSQTIITTFSLRFNSEADLSSFINYYKENYPGLLVQEQMIRYQAGQLTSIKMDTRKLYEEVAEWLGGYSTRDTQLGRHVN
ncbi:hypothetical protein NF27_BL00010, partial [Candidatus Jidaibacter acanthamoeba]